MIRSTNEQASWSAPRAVAAIEAQPERNQTLITRIGSASLQLAACNAVVRLLSLISMPILTHLLAPQAYGTAAMVGTIMSLVSVIALAGMDMSYVRAYQDTSILASSNVEAFAWRYVLGSGFLAACILGLAWPLIAHVFLLPEYLGAVVALGTILSLVSTMTQARARLNSRYRAMSLSILVAGAAGTAISLGVAQWWHQTELPLVLAVLTGYLVPVLILGSPPVVRLFHFSGLSATERWHVLSIGLAGMITAPIYWVMSSLDRWFLGFFTDAATVGIYSMGYSVAIMGMMVNTTILSVWTPETAKEFQQNPERAQWVLGRIAERLIAGFACVWLAVTAGGGDVIRMLASSSFHEAASIVPAIAAAVMFHGVVHVANATFLLMKRLNLTLWFWSFGALISIALNLILIPLWGMRGAAIAQVTSFCLLAVGMVLGAQWLYPLKAEWRRLSYVLTGIIVAGFFMFPSWHKASYVSLLLKLPVGVMVVVVVAFSTSPELLRMAVQKIQGSMLGEKR